MESGSNKIYADYLKTRRSWIVRRWVIVAIEAILCVVVFTFNNGVSFFFGLAILACFLIAAVDTTLNIAVFTKRKLDTELNAMTEDKRNALLTQYETAHAIGSRKFLDEYLVYSYGTQLVLLKYRDIRSAELKGYKLLLDIGEKRPLKMPFDAEENPALLVAAMRSRNPDISVILNGKVVEKMEKK